MHSVECTGEERTWVGGKGWGGEIKGSKVKSSKIMRVFCPASTAAEEQSALSNWVSQSTAEITGHRKLQANCLDKAVTVVKSSKVLDTRSAAANQADRKSCSLSL